MRSSCFSRRISIAAFTNAGAYVGENPQAEGKPGFMSAKQELGTWLMFPRDDAAVKLIQDGRWELPPNPVQWEILPKLGRPLALRRVPGSRLTVLLMTRPEDCFAIAMPFETEGHFSVYLSLFGRDCRRRQDRTVARAACSCSRHRSRSRGRWRLRDC